MFEGYMTLAAWAMATERVRLGLMVGANPYRNPALVAKMVTALDHISGGRAYLGIGSAWDESEAKAFGIEMGESPGGATALAARGTAGDARHAARRGALGGRAALRDGRRAQRPAAGAGAPADRRRRRGRERHAAPRRALRGRVQHRLCQRHRGLQAQGRGAAAALRRRSAATSARSSGP